MYEDVHAARCRLCGEGQAAKVLGVCRKCILERFEEARPFIRTAHTVSRASWGLPATVPSSGGGVKCPVCARGCSIAEGELGYCGLRRGERSPTSGVMRLRWLAGSAERGLLEWYRDPLPTNCVAAWFCPGTQNPGMHNLAVFYGGCPLDCLFCQNWQYRELVRVMDPLTSWLDLASKANERTFCVCFFGGDPACQMPHALAVARKLEERGIRVCWETCGLASPPLMDAAFELSFRSGGIVKFDLKASSSKLAWALTGSDNTKAWENFVRIATAARLGGRVSSVMVSTLLVPYYVTPDEVFEVARRVAEVDAEVPFSLLAFAPAFMFSDLPPTSRRHARLAEEAARSAGLTNVHIGNRHLLWGTP